MASSSSLDPDNFPSADRNQNLPKGHDTRSLGPGDSSDSGSDMAGPGLIDDEALPLDRGTNEDQEAGRDDIADAGASIGDDHMDGNSDRYGTGERRAAGKEPSVRADNDLEIDRVIGADEAGLNETDEAQLGITEDIPQSDDEEEDEEEEGEDDPLSERHTRKGR
jgi:hypothetical protein